ncbi:MAG: MBL fold metallo-hydrolase [Planctomycetes bacterium]|nr:MBL fold metallo-hydrolase [Planctomycetota bacterium]
MMSRREFVQTTAAMACLASPLAHAFGADDAPTFLEWRSVGKGVWVAIGSGGNSVLIKGRKGAVLVDCKNAPYGACLRRESEALAKPMAFVVNTHHHADHTGGNHAFSPDIEIIAQDKCTDRVIGQMNRYMSQMKESIDQLADKKGPAADLVRKDAKELYLKHTKMIAPNFAPKTTFAKERELDLGDRKVTLTYAGPGHTDNDVVVFVPSENILHTGDLLFQGRHPYVDKDGGGSTKQWQEAIKRVIAMCNEKTVVIPGHGDSTDVNGLKAQDTYFDTMREIVAKARQAGKTRKEVAEMVPEKYANYPASTRSIALGALYDEAGAEGGGK